MIAISLALLSALCYGTSDFVAGVVSNRISPWTVALWGEITATVVVAVVAVGVGGSPTPADLIWATVSGLGTGVGIAFLYRGFATGRMGVVAPLSAVGAAVVPVLAGLIGGERPAGLVWVGIAIAMPAIWLISREPTGSDAGGTGTGGAAAGVVDGVIAGVGFGFAFAAIAQVPDSSGLWPVAVSFVVATAVVFVGALLVRAPLLARRGRDLAPIVGSGLLGAMALTGFMVASQHGHLTVVGVVSSLYPAVTILLAATVLRERIHLGQGLGLALSAGAVTLVAVG